MKKLDKAPVLRLATPDDRAMLEAWDREPHVLAFSGEDDVFDWEYELPRKVDWRELIIAEYEGRSFCFVQVIDPREEETHYWGDAPPNLRAIDIWIGPAEMLGRGLGTQVMTQVITRCFAPPSVEAILIDPLAANKRAIKFYKSLGFEEEGRRIFGEDDCLVLRLARANWVG